MVDSKVDKRNSPFIALEAIARISEHAFEYLGITRIEAGQHIDLTGWQQRMELVGYKFEGIHRNKFVKGMEVTNEATIACLLEDYHYISKFRGGLWDSAEKMKTRYKNLPQKAFMDLYNEFYRENSDYYEQLFSN